MNRSCESLDEITKASLSAEGVVISDKLCAHERNLPRGRADHTNRKERKSENSNRSLRKAYDARLSSGLMKRE